MQSALVVSRGMILSETDDAVERLKAHFKVATDADLARRLAVDKSTVSAWRARQKLPQRYQRMLEGDDHQAGLTPPARWGDYEKAAFELAVFRFARATSKELGEGDFRALFQIYTKVFGVIWSMQRQAQQDIAAQIEKGRVEHPREATILLIHDDLAAGETAVQRDRKEVLKLTFLEEE